MSDADKVSRSDIIRVEWPDLVKFVRQLSHDLRNHLNAVELQSAYLGELAGDPELKDEIKRLRQMTSELGTTLQKLSASVAQPKPNLMPYPANDYLEDLRKRVEADFPKEASSIDWEVSASEASIQIDPQLLQQAMLELFANAFRHTRSEGKLKLQARVDRKQLVFALTEPKSSFDSPTAEWGRQPLRSIGHGHYGLGLNRVRLIVESLGGTLSAEHNKAAATLVTTVTLPADTKIG
jgi:K+-sensing histidine kinase KdpD